MSPRPASLQGEDQFIVSAKSTHHILSFLYSETAKFSNNSCGVALALHTHRFQKLAVTEVSNQPTRGSVDVPSVGSLLNDEYTSHGCLFAALFGKPPFGPPQLTQIDSPTKFAKHLGLQLWHDLH